MKLHQTTGAPDWEAAKPATWNRWQRLAARTQGVITPANIVSLAGLTMVVVGLVYIMYQNLAAGFWLIAAGRLCDIFDGAVADHTGTKSPLGEAIDASFDKIGALGVLIIFGIEHIVPWWVIIVVGIQNLANATIGYTGRRRKLSIHPELAGKVSTACLWASFFSFILASTYGATWSWLAYIMLIPAFALGVAATMLYGKQLVPPIKVK